MALIEEISRAIAESMKARDQARLVPLRMLKAALMNREVERGSALDETESRQVVSGLVKQRRDSVEQFLKGGRKGRRSRKRRRRRDGIHRRHVTEGSRPGDESRDGCSCRKTG